MFNIQVLIISSFIVHRRTEPENVYEKHVHIFCENVVVSIHYQPLFKYATYVNLVLFILGTLAKHPLYDLKKCVLLVSILSLLYNDVGDSHCDFRRISISSKY